MAYPEIHHDFEFYDVYPNEENNLKAALKEATPISSEGKKFHGRTNWYVKWNYKWKKRDGRCWIVSVKTKLDVNYIMPRIPNDHQVKRSVRYAFGKYYALLFKHEQGHKESGLLAAQRIEDSLRRLGYFRSCKKLERAANKKGQDIIELFNKRDKEYDDKSDHGQRDGVNINLFI